MKKWALDISYNGAKYAGWQIQAHANTVQAELTHALRLLLGETVETRGAGRTDAGVHAKQMIVDLECETELTSKLVYRLNSMLPVDICINRLLRPLNPEFNARFDATSRTYQYFIALKKDPFLVNNAWYYWGTLDLEKMNEACAVLFKYEEFGAFAKAHGQQKTNVCEIIKAEWVKEGDMLVFTIEANRFLRGMVRAIVGTMTDIGRRKISVADFEAIIESQDRKLAGVSAPAHALFLTEVNYPEGTFEQKSSLI
ncbi:MAG: tRNA pseudouridine(38-40) synthase TruA [Bacteroidia bacterium]